MKTSITEKLIHCSKLHAYEEVKALCSKKISTLLDAIKLHSCELAYDAVCVFLNNINSVSNSLETLDVQFRLRYLRSLAVADRASPAADGNAACALAGIFIINFLKADPYAN